MKQQTIYIGLNDAETREQRFDTEKYVSILKRVCRSYAVAFSMHMLDGGYFHDDGTYVEEKTLALSMIDVDEGIVSEIAKDLCAFFHQESVMVTSSPVDVVFVRETLETV